MKFSLNYSPQAADLLRKGQIELDFFKTPPWPDMIAEAEKLCPIRVHFNLGAGDQEEPNWREIESFLAKTSTLYINTHLGIKCSEMPHIPANEHPSTTQRAEILDRLLSNVEKMTRYFGPERVIIENIPFRTNENSTLMACANPEIISQVVEKTGCGFLLDVSHARISAHYLGIDAHEYIEALPVRHLRELHFTGIHDWDGYKMDHLSILEQDWPWLEWILANVNHGNWGNAHMLAFEYGGIGEFFQRFSDPEVMTSQVPRLYKLCHTEKGTKANPPY